MGKYGYRFLHVCTITKDLNSTLYISKYKQLLTLQHHIWSFVVFKIFVNIIYFVIICFTIRYTLCLIYVSIFFINFLIKWTVKYEYMTLRNQQMLIFWDGERNTQLLSVPPFPGACAIPHGPGAFRPLASRSSLDSARSKHHQF